MKERKCDICFHELNFEKYDSLDIHEVSHLNDFSIDFCDYHSTIMFGLIRTWIHKEKEAYFEKIKKTDDLVNG